MALSVIGAGFGRTGTMSIKMALEQLGFGPCHHMIEVYANPEKISQWETAVKGEPVEWSNVFEGYQTAVDWPTCHFWRELAGYYPDAKVLLSVRPPENWWNSFSKTIKQLLETRNSIPDSRVQRILEMANEMIAIQTFEGRTGDRQLVLKKYQQHIDEVVATISPDRLLVFDIAEGWEPLCTWLEVEQPSEEFPRTNSNDAFWQQFGLRETSCPSV